MDDRRIKNTKSENSDPQKDGLGSLRPIFLKIAPEEIVYLKSILEGYDYLGIIRTLNKDTGEVVILALDEALAELRPLLESLQSEIDFREIPQPASVESDWLLAEYRHLLNS